MVQVTGGQILAYQVVVFSVDLDQLAKYGLMGVTGLLSVLDKKYEYH